MGIRENIKRYKPALIGIIYMIYFYIFVTITYKNSWLIPLKDVTLSNIGKIVIVDFFSMLIFALAIIIVYRNKLFELGIKKSKLSIILLAIYILAFILNRDYTVRGIYKAFFYLFIVALPEEVIHRGYIYNSLKKHNKISAIIISGVLFGIMHSILPSIISESGLLIMVKNMFNELAGGILGGFMFIFYLEKSGSIFVPILIHALLDYNYSILGLVVAIAVLVYLFITDKRNKEESKVTNKNLVEEGNLFEDNSRN